MQAEIAVLVERAHIAGMQPAAGQRLRCRLRVIPVAQHDGITAADDLPHRARRQRPVLRIDHPHLDHALRLPGRGDALLPARMIAHRILRLGHAGDGHRTFALPVKLCQLVAQHIERLFQVGHIHRRAAIDDGLQIAEVRPADARMIHETLHHGRRREQRQPPVMRDEVRHLRRVETARLGDHLRRPHHHVRQHVEAGAVRQRGGVQDGIAGGDGIDIDEIAEAHGAQIAVAQHRALGPACGAAGVEKPGEVIVSHRRHWGGVGLQHSSMVRRTGADDALQRRQLARQPGDHRLQIGGDKAQTRAAMLEDVLEFAGMQLAVDRYGGKAGMPDAIEQHHIVRAVLHRQRNPVAGLEPHGL